APVPRGGLPPDLPALARAGSTGGGPAGGRGVRHPPELAPPQAGAGRGVRWPEVIALGPPSRKRRKRPSGRESLLTHTARLRTVPPLEPQSYRSVTGGPAWLPARRRALSH